MFGVGKKSAFASIWQLKRIHTVALSGGSKLIRLSFVISFFYRIFGVLLYVRSDEAAQLTWLAAVSDSRTYRILQTPHIAKQSSY